MFKSFHFDKQGRRATNAYKSLKVLYNHFQR